MIHPVRTLRRLLITTLIPFVLASVITTLAIADEAVVWIGTGNPRIGESKGIYRATLNLETGALSTPEVAAEIRSPGFLTVGPKGDRLYSVCQLPDGKGGGVAAYEITGDKQSLHFINTQPIGDGGAAHITVDHSERCVITAQYGGGSVAVFPLDSRTRALRPRSALIEHAGSGPDRSRQEGPHPHWTGVSADNRFLFIPDLGIDRVVIYRLNPENGTIHRHGEGACPPGHGPRHMKFHPNGRIAYVLNELGLSVRVFDYDAAQGRLDPIQTITTLPESMREIRTTGSEIRVHPTGRFVYTANRGHDSITVFGVDESTGKLRFVEHESVRGHWPRNFNVDPTGRWLVAGGQHSNSLTVFEIDADTGGLQYTGQWIPCPSPICIEFQR